MQEYPNDYILKQKKAFTTNSVSVVEVTFLSWLTQDLSHKMLTKNECKLTVERKFDLYVEILEKGKPYNSFLKFQQIYSEKNVFKKSTL